MNPVMLEIFGLEIKWYSFLILVGIIIGIILLEKEAKKFKIPKDRSEERRVGKEC